MKTVRRHFFGPLFTLPSERRESPQNPVARGRKRPLSGFRAKRMGSEGEPDVVATAPLGDRAYTVVVECKTVATADDQVRNPAA